MQLLAVRDILVDMKERGFLLSWAARKARLLFLLIQMKYTREPSSISSILERDPPDLSVGRNQPFGALLIVRARDFEFDGMTVVTCPHVSGDVHVCDVRVRCENVN